MNPFRPTRKNSLRFPDHDYAQNGAYFITITAHEGIPLFGQVTGGQCILSNFGEIVREEWQRTGEKRDGLLLDAYCVMPNHIHAIMMLTGDRTSAPRAFGKMAPQSLSAIVRAFKSAVSKRINEVRNSPGAPVWQPNFYESYLRTDRALDECRRYIHENPLKWDLDEFYTGNHGR